MADTEFRIVLTLLTVIVVGCMILDQQHLKQMTRKKWWIAAFLFTLMIGNIWVGAAS